MKLLLCLMSLWLGLLPALAYADAPPSETKTENIELKKLEPLDVLTELPRTTWRTLKFSFQRDSVPYWDALIVSTALLYHYDSDIYESAQAQGRRWGIGNSDNTKTVLHMGDIPLLRLPSDTGSALYFLGDGWTHFGISAGFIGYGYFQNNTRAWNTGLEIVHGMIVSTILNQTLKRSTGRESPDRRTSKRGTWRPFPSVKAYQSHTPNYDAFPSGHLMTVTLVFTTIRLNYPEYNAYVLPLQIVWSSALMFQMMNNGVHWASDYPLGFAMGWAVAQMAYHMGQPDSALKGDKDKAKREAERWHFFPSIDQDGNTLVSAMRSF